MNTDNKFTNIIFHFEKECNCHNNDFIVMHNYEVVFSGMSVLVKCKKCGEKFSNKITGIEEKIK